MRTGRKAFSSKLPSAPPICTATSELMIWMQTMSIASAWVGLTLPGMIDEPGSLDGRISSISPVRGPEPNHRMSLAILNRVTDADFNPAWARTMRSRVPWAANLLSAVLNRYPVSLAMTAATSSPNPAGELRPVPTAVPPMASRSRPAVACSTSTMASASAAA